MSRPIVPIPDEQARRGHLAMAEHLGLDPKQITSAGFTVTTSGADDGMALVTWSGVVSMPADEAFGIMLGGPASGA